jgi:hypothetical protein
MLFLMSLDLEPIEIFKDNFYQNIKYMVMKMR